MKKYFFFAVIAAVTLSSCGAGRIVSEKSQYAKERRSIGTGGNCPLRIWYRPFKS